MKQRVRKRFGFWTCNEPPRRGDYAYLSPGDAARQWFIGVLASSRGPVISVPEFEAQERGRARK